MSCKVYFSPSLFQALKYVAYKCGPRGSRLGSQLLEICGFYVGLHRFYPGVRDRRILLGFCTFCNAVSQYYSGFISGTKNSVHRVLA